MKLVKTLRRGAAIFGHFPSINRIVKICSGLITAVFLLRFELLFMEVVVVVGLVVLWLIGAGYLLGCTAASRLRSGLRALSALVSATRQQRFAKTTTTGLSKANAEVS